MRLLIGKTLYQLRKKRKLPQAIVAKHASVSRPTYSGWEGDRGCPTYIQVYRIIKLYSMSMQELTCLIEKDNEELKICK